MHLGDGASPEAFCANTLALRGLREGLAEVAQVDVEGVDVACSGSRRLAGDRQRRLSGSVAISYAVKVPATTSVSSGVSAADAAWARLGGMDKAALMLVLSDHLAQAGVAVASAVSVTSVAAPTKASSGSTSAPPPPGIAPAEGNEKALPKLLEQAQDAVIKASVLGWWLAPIGVAACCCVCLSTYCCCCRRRRRLKTEAKPSEVKAKSVSIDGKAAAAVPKQASFSQTKSLQAGSADEVAVKNSSRVDLMLSKKSSERRSPKGNDAETLRDFSTISTRWPARGADDTGSESTLATSASAFWRNNMALRTSHGRFGDHGVVLQVTDERNSRAVERTREFSPSRGPANRYAGHWLRRGSPDFSAEIRDDSVRYQDGSERRVRIAEDGALELLAMGGELCRGRLLGEELLWDDGDMWSRARSAAYSWRMAEPPRVDAGETPGPSEHQFWPSNPPVRHPAPLRDEFFDSRGQGLCGPDEWPAGGELPVGSRAEEVQHRRRASDRCYTC